MNEEIELRINKLEKRISNCWEMATTYIENRDPHGLHDIGVDIQTLQGAIRELRAVQTCAPKERESFFNPKTIQFGMSAHPSDINQIYCKET